MMAHVAPTWLHAATAPVSSQLPVWVLSGLYGAGTLHVRCTPAMAHGTVRMNARGRTDGAQQLYAAGTVAAQVRVEKDRFYSAGVSDAAGRVRSRVRPSTRTQPDDSGRVQTRRRLTDPPGIIGALVTAVDAEVVAHCAHKRLPW